MWVCRLRQYRKPSVHLERRDWLEIKGEGPAKRKLLTRPRYIA